MMYAIATASCIAVLALLAYQAFRIVKGYRASTGTPWQRFLAAFSDSLTIFVARCGAFVSIIVAVLTQMLPEIDPTSAIGTAITSVIEPKYVPWYGLAFAVLIELVRRRPGSIDPIQPPAQDK